MLPSFIQRNVHRRNTDILPTKTFFKYFLLRINDKNRLFFHRAHLSASCNLERLRYNGKHSAKPFVRADAEWAGAEHLPNPIKIGKRNRYESTHKSGQNAGCQVQLHQLILRIAIGLVVGSVLALICPGAAWIEEFGNLFVGALKGVAPVLVFVIVASALRRAPPSWTAALVRWSGCTCSPPLWRLRSAL